jgi:hypothetical protein
MYKKSPDTSIYMYNKSLMMSKLIFKKDHLVRATTIYGVNLYEKVLGSSFELDSQAKKAYKFNGEIMPFTRYPENRDKSLIFSVRTLSGLYKFSTENVYILSLGFALRKNDFRFKLFRDTFQRLHEAGIIPYKLKDARYSDYGNYKKIIEPVEVPKSYVPLDLRILEAGFIIWLVAVGISIIVFIGEIVHFNIMKCFKKRQKKKTKKKSKIKAKVMKVNFDYWKKFKWWLSNKIYNIRTFIINRVSPM